MDDATANKVILGSSLALIITSIIVLYFVSSNPFFVLIVGSGIAVACLILITMMLGINVGDAVVGTTIFEQGKVYDFSIDEGIEEYYNNMAIDKTNDED